MGLRIGEKPLAGYAPPPLGRGAARETVVNPSREVYSASGDRLATPWLADRPNFVKRGRGRKGRDDAMAVLVTGGAGYIGGHMMLGLIDAGEDVVVLDNLSTGFAWAVPPAAKLVVGDFGDAALVARTDRASMASTRSPISPPRSSCPNRSPTRSAIISTTPPRRAA